VHTDDLRYFSFFAFSSLELVSDAFICDLWWKGADVNWTFFCVVCMCSEEVSSKFYFCLTSKTFLSWCYLLIWEDSRGLWVNLNLCFIAANHMTLFFLKSPSCAFILQSTKRSIQQIEELAFNALLSEKDVFDFYGWDCKGGGVFMCLNMADEYFDVLLQCTHWSQCLSLNHKSSAFIVKYTPICYTRSKFICIFVNTSRYVSLGF
jgi:hypothetical protein